MTTTNNAPDGCKSNLRRTLVDGLDCHASVKCCWPLGGVCAFISIQCRLFEEQNNERMEHRRGKKFPHRRWLRRKKKKKKSLRQQTDVPKKKGEESKQDTQRQDPLP